METKKRAHNSLRTKEKLKMSLQINWSDRILHSVLQIVLMLLFMRAAS